MLIKVLFRFGVVGILTNPVFAGPDCEIYQNMVVGEKERYGNVSLFEDIVEKLGVPVTVAEAPAAHPTIHDSPFKSFYFDNTEYQYGQLPDSVKLREFTNDLYYGRPVKSLEEAKKSINIMFQYGRNSRGKGHRSISEHIYSTKYGGPSGFFQTSIDFQKAKEFATKISNKLILTDGGLKKLGVVFAIDPKGAEVLSISDLINHLGSEAPFKDESEVVFSDTIKPTRIKGAIIIQFDQINDTESVLGVVKNPNYLPSK